MTNPAGQNEECITWKKVFANTVWCGWVFLKNGKPKFTKKKLSLWYWHRPLAQFCIAISGICHIWRRRRCCDVSGQHMLIRTLFQFLSPFLYVSLWYVIIVFRDIHTVHWGSTILSHVARASRYSRPICTCRCVYVSVDEVGLGGVVKGFLNALHSPHPPPKKKKNTKKKSSGSDERWVVQGGDKVVRAGG